MTTLNLENISLSFGTNIILDKINFSINEGDKLGIVGVNGAGKTSLFKLILSEYTPDSGNVYISKDKSIGILDQNINFNNDNTILNEMLLSFESLLNIENQLSELHDRIERGDVSVAEQYASLHDKFLNSGGYEYKSRCKGTLKNLGFTEEFWDLKIENLSGGQKTRLALVRLLLKEPDILMLDEPTNHLDITVLYWLESFLRQYRKTVIVISHDRYFLDSVTNKILEIENCKGKLYNGNYTAYVNQKANDREVQEKQYKTQQKEIKRMEEMIERFRSWNREKSIKTAEHKQKMLDRMEKIEHPEKLPEAIRLRFNKSGESGNDVLTIKNLSKSYPNKILFKDFNILIKKHEHVFIIGENGCGKSTLIKIISEKLSPDDGTFEYGYNIKVGYYDQENQELNDDNTVLDEIYNEYDQLTQTEIRNALALFLFKGDDIEKPVSVLSGGERARLTFVKLILSKMNLLILDEPTNHLDINSREALEHALLNFDGTIIAVSHDRYFINKLATRIFDFNATELYSIYDYRGSYAEYVDYKNTYLIKTSQIETKISESREQYLYNKRIESEQRRYENKIKRTQAEIESIESAIEVLDIENVDHSDYEKLIEVSEQKANYENKLLELYELLEELLK